MYYVQLHKNGLFLPLLIIITLMLLKNSSGTFHLHLIKKNLQRKKNVIYKIKTKTISEIGSNTFEHSSTTFTPSCNVSSSTIDCSSSNKPTKTDSIEESWWTSVTSKPSSWTISDVSSFTMLTCCRKTTGEIEDAL